MVTRYGMSDKLGPMMFGQKEEMIFLGREISEQRDYSEAVAEEIDEEVRKIVNWAYDEARRILHENRDRLQLVAERLLEVETLDGDEFAALMGDVPAEKSNVSSTPSTPIGDATESSSPENRSGKDLPTLGAAPSPA
jgi:cell division protease FtsH